MKIRKMVAPSMQEALDKVKSELGPDAMILSARHVKARWFLGIIGKARVEVTAAIDDDDPRFSGGSADPVAKSQGQTASRAEMDVRMSSGASARQAYLSSASTDSGPTRQAYLSSSSPDLLSRTREASRARQPVEDRMDATTLAVTAEEAQSGSNVDSAAEFETIKRELRDLRRVMATLVDGSRVRAEQKVFTGVLMSVFRRLVDSDIEEETARLLVESVSGDLRQRELEDLGVIHAKLVDKVERLIPVAGDIELTEGKTRVVALIGPTGVGKTTTIAKLAAGYSLARKKRVALITADTYRIAAIEQLKTYSEIIGVPIEVVYAPEEMQAALERHRDKDLVLVDTAGRSPRNSARILELRGFIKAARPDETHLVISTTTKNRDAMDIVERFEQVGFDRLIFTKLDESANHGVILNTLVRAQRPLSYLGTGQNVPEDLEVASTEKLAHLITGDWGEQLVDLCEGSTRGA